MVQVLLWKPGHAGCYHSRGAESFLPPRLRRRAAAAVLRAQFKGQTVLIGCDDMDLFKGIELKLLALERVLDYHPEWRGRLVLVQVTNAPRQGGAHSLHHS